MAERAHWLGEAVGVFYRAADQNKLPGVRTLNFEVGVLALLAWGAKRKLEQRGDMRCHDCGCAEGEYHKPGCDTEACPFCFGQLISCGCRYERFGYVPYDTTDATRAALLRTDHPEVYRNGLPKEKAEIFDSDVRKEGRLRYVAWPVLCDYCGRRMACDSTDPAADLHWSVPDEEWQRNVPRSHWERVLCRPCYNHLEDALTAAPKVVLEEGRE